MQLEATVMGSRMPRPGSYLVREAFMVLEIASRMGAGGWVGGGCPIAWWDSLSPGVQGLLMSWVRLARMEEAVKK